MFAASLLAVSVASCSDKDNEESSYNKGGDYVSFSVGGNASRTIRHDGYEYQIDWVKGDLVRVYSDQAATATGGRYADYTVTPSEGTTQSKGKLDYNDKGLLWPEEDVTCWFYAAYPANAVKDCSDGKIQFELPSFQKAQVATESDGNYTCGIDMSNAYMVAKQSAKGGDAVSLQFSPIMTTLDVTLVNSLSNSEALTLTGINIEIENYKIASSSDGKFEYDMANNKIVTDDSGSSSISIYTSFCAADGTPNLTLANGKSVKFTTFLPPVEISESRKVKVSVHCGGIAPEVVELGGNTMSSGSKLEFAASSLGKIKLSIKKKSEKKDWMGEIDDNTLLSQLSLPGVNESFSFLSNGEMQNQILSFADQLSYGCRAFGFKFENGNLMVDGTQYKKSDSNYLTILELIRNYIIPFLKEHPSEFIVFLVDAKLEINYFQGLEEQYYWYNNESARKISEMMIPFKNDLTIGECRGKFILASCGANQTNVSFNREYIGSLGPVTTPNSETTQKEDEMIANELGQTKWETQNYQPDTYYYYGKNSEKSVTERVSLMEQQLERAKTNDAMNLCFLAGYDKGNNNTDGYKANAKTVHPAIVDWLNKQTEFGPLGIVYMDYIGTDVIDGQKVYGDLLPQLIIDQNYKFKMKKRGN